MTNRSLIKISSQKLSAEINAVGAQLYSFRDQAGNDLQWHGDAEVWKGRAPVLFPIVGALVKNQYRLDGRAFHLAKHGFARDRLFSLVEASSACALFRLDWNEETFSLYPFKFQLDLHFALHDATLRIVATVRNLENTIILPASFGFHPAFRWPLPYGASRTAHFLEFERAEPGPIRRLDFQGLLTQSEFVTPVKNCRLELSDDLFTADAMIFDQIVSRRLRYGADEGPQLQIEFADMPYLGVWTKPGAGFICIEPWHGLADPQGYSEDFRAKPGIVLVSPGKSKEFAISISLISQ